MVVKLCVAVDGFDTEYGIGGCRTWCGEGSDSIQEAVMATVYQPEEKRGGNPLL